ncbi:MAG: hypothetical protein IJ735_05200 [Clostridia bacterium]|nr:hypothetical protein [Clostridia bacterium]
MAKKLERLSDHISVLSDFQFSINLEYDLYSDQKIKNYIPTLSAIDIIEDVMLSTSPKSTDRSRIFVGAYGKGKSHLALVLLALLSRKDKTLYSDVLSMICQTKPELCSYIVKYQESKQRMLPVVIQGSSVGIRQSLLLGLRKALESADLGAIMPTTYYGAAIKTIDNWQQNYIDTFEKFKRMIPCTVEEFKAELNNYNAKYYRDFISFYPVLSSGGEFNPINGIDIVEVYNDVNNIIQKHGYTGIFVVYDEFSKFLSGNLKNTDTDEIEVLQYFAEACTRSGEKQMHIMLISHQSILNYVDKLPKSKINSWKAVSQRYKSVELNTSAAQMYDLTAHVIKKEEKWYKDFLSNEYVSNSFQKVYNKWKDKRTFAELTPEQYENLIYGCYPLEPITAFVLPEISEKIAQNERTLFTFLSANGQRYTLPMYLANTELKDVPFLTPDYVYDYFESLFKADSYDHLTHKYWKIASSALNKVGKEHGLERRLIKTLALIYIIDRFELLMPTVETLMSIYNSNYNDANEIIPALTFLTDNGIIRKLEGKEFLKITEYTGKSVESLITDTLSKRRAIVNIEETLNRFCGDRVIYPNAYNDDNEIVRYFNFKFIEASKVLKGFFEDERLKEIDGDGIVYAVVADMDQIDSVVSVIKGILTKRIVFIISNEQENLVSTVRRYDAIKNLVSEYKDDEVLVEELTYSLNALEEVLAHCVDSYLHPEMGFAKYYVAGENKAIKRRSALSKLLSEICEEEYKLCPVINNELINKNILTGQATNSRLKVVNGLLSNELKNNLGLEGTGQEVSFMRSALCYTGILTKTQDKPFINLEPDDEKLKNVLGIIKDYIVSTSTEGKKSIAVLYDLLINPKHHIGLKKGLIPIFFATVLRYYKKYCVISKNNRELEITARLLEAIDNNPDSYDFYLENWDDQKDQYIQNLERLFDKYIIPAEKEYNNFTYIVAAMQRWYMQLPKYVKEIQHIYLGNGKNDCCDKTVTKFLSALRNPEINARDFLFNKILWVFGEQKFSPKLAGYVARAKTIIDGIKPDLILRLKDDLANIFSFGKRNVDATLSSIVKDWTSSLSQDVIAHMFNGNENNMLSICLNITPDENKFIEELARTTTSLRIDDWSEITIDAFIKTVSDFVETINNFKDRISETNDISAGSYRITFIDETGKESYRTFDKTEYTRSAKLLYDDATSLIEEYGESLSNSEKRQVLIDIINNLLW